MAFSVEIVEGAERDLERIRSFERSEIIKTILNLLTVNPTLESKSRIKRLRPPAPAQYRLRVGEFRVLYDVEDNTVVVLRVVTKTEANAILDKSLKGSAGR